MYLTMYFFFHMLGAMNMTVCRSTNCSPYKLVFGQDPLVRFALLDELQRLDIIHEEDIPKGAMDELSIYNARDTLVIDEENLSMPCLQGIFDDSVSTVVLFQMFRVLNSF